MKVTQKTQVHTEPQIVYYNQRKLKDSNPYKELIMEFLPKKVFSLFGKTTYIYKKLTWAVWVVWVVQAV